MGSTDIKAYEDFLQRFPEGPAADSARKVLAELKSSSKAAQ
jgi:hypothetical protein